MRLNFWQWLGVVLLVVGLTLYFRKHMTRTEPVLPSDPSSAPVPTLTTAPAAPY